MCWCFAHLDYWLVNADMLESKQSVVQTCCIVKHLTKATVDTPDIGSLCTSLPEEGIHIVACKGPVSSEHLPPTFGSQSQTEQHVSQTLTSCPPPHNETNKWKKASCMVIQSIISAIRLHTNHTDYNLFFLFYVPKLYPLGSPFWWYFCVCNCFLIQPLK